MLKVADAPSPSSRKFSPEIHGIRGIALTMVVAFHLFGAGRVSGGVDVFLVLSSYLLTGSMIRAIEDGRLSLVYRYGRTFSRLLPAALLTITLSLGVGVLVLPKSRWLGLFEQGGAAALFAESNYLATTGLTYEAAGNDASPFQHFWSLSMQGQFFLLWPALVFVLIYVLSRTRTSLKLAALAAIALVVTAVSFVYSIRLVELNQPLAYYSLGARLWEFTLAALAAFVLRGVRRSSKMAEVAGWVGVALILSSGFIVDGANTFPGPWALWPVAGALLVLFSAESGGAKRSGLTAVLTWPPIVWLANRGYALYLFHWPILVFALAFFGLREVGVLGAIAVLALSFVLTEVTMVLVSKPFVRWANREQRTVRGRVVLVSTLLSGALAVAAVAQVAASLERSRLDRVAEEIRTAEVPELVSEPTEAGEKLDLGVLVPAPDAAFGDLPAIYSEGCVQNTKPEPEFGEVKVCPDVPGEGATPAIGPDVKKVVMSGGSHVIQFYPAFRQIADQQGWELVVIDKDGCRLEAEMPGEKRSEACRLWNEQAVGIIAEQEPNLVITLGSGTTNKGGTTEEESVSPARVAVWEELNDMGIPVLALRDTPRLSEPVPACLETKRDAAACGVRFEDIYRATNPLLQADLPPLTSVLDVSDQLCFDGTCPAVIGKLTVYRDNSHLTATAAKALAGEIENQMREAVPWMFED